MTFTPASGDQVTFDFFGKFKPPSGASVVVRPPNTLVYREAEMRQVWSLFAARQGLLTKTDQWTLKAPVFGDVSARRQWILRVPLFADLSPQSAWSLFIPSFSDQAADQAWSLIAPIFNELEESRQWSLKAFTFAAIAPSASYLLEATAVWTPVITRTAYVFRLEYQAYTYQIPISTFSGQVRSGEPTYLQVTIPDARRWGEAIRAYARYPATRLVISAGYGYTDGRYAVVEIARAKLRNVRFDVGARSQTVTLDGVETRENSAPKTVLLKRASYKNLSSEGLRRFRCPVDFSVRPGDTVIFEGEVLTEGTFVVGEISYTVTPLDGQMEVAEKMQAA